MKISRPNVHLESTNRGWYACRLGHGGNKMLTTGSLIWWPWMTGIGIDRESHHSLQHCHCDITTRTSNAHGIAQAKFTFHEQISNVKQKKGDCKKFCPTCCTLLDQMWQRLFSPIFPAQRAHNGTLAGSTRAPVRATSGTFVPHGSERTLGRYLTAPVTLPPPTSDNLLRQGARACACRTRLCARCTLACV